MMFSTLRSAAARRLPSVAARRAVARSVGCPRQMEVGRADAHHVAEQVVEVQAAGVPHLGWVGSSGAGTGAAGSAATWWAVPFPLGSPSQPERREAGAGR